MDRTLPPLLSRPHSHAALPPLFCLILLAVLSAGCRKAEQMRAIELKAIERLYAHQENVAPTEYRLDAQPFSPTLPYLFDQARIVVLPKGSVGAPPAGVHAEIYAFSAIDRFGRLYHFDTLARWWMAEGMTLPEPLPPGQWAAAWNAKTAKLELLVSAPWAGGQTIQLLSWNQGAWSQAALTHPPQARQDARALFLAGENRWLVLGGTATGGALADGWIIKGTGWNPWPGAEAAAEAPTPDQLGALIDGPDGSGPIVLTRSGAIWIWKTEHWKAAGNVKVENLRLACYVPALRRFLFVWGRGRGQDQILWQTLEQIENGSTSMPAMLSQTGMVRINDRDEGLWKGWGRARAEKDKLGQTVQRLEPGFQGEGEPAIQLTGLTNEQIFRRSAIGLLELPPVLESVRFEATAWVPVLGGLVAPSVNGVGINVRREPFFPSEAWDAGTTSATQPLIDVIEHGYRFWIFREKSLDFLKPPSEIHPGIDYTSSYQTLDHRRRCLAWTSPEPGMLRYDFHEFLDNKVQWVNSPRLTLKKIPQLALTPEDKIFITDPVVWGDPAEVIVIGWCGSMGTRVDSKNPPEGFTDEARTQNPDRGFMARINALEPAEWKVSTLPIPFCQGAQLVVVPDRNSLFVVGGKTFEPIEANKQKLFFGRSQTDVWHWDGEAWRKIASKDGIQPRMKATSHVIYDPASRQLLSLTPRALYGFADDVWHCLWQRPKTKGDWPEDVALYVHPQSQLVLGAWFMPRANLRVWQQQGWIPVTTQEGDAATSPTARGEAALPEHSDDLIPSTLPDAFISVSAERLGAIRMDAPRNRDDDRLLGAFWLTFKAANAGAIAHARRPLAREAASLTTVTAVIATAATTTNLTTSTVASAPSAATTAMPSTTTTVATVVAADAVTTAVIKEANDGKVYKKTHTGLLLRRLETLATP